MTGCIALTGCNLAGKRPISLFLHSYSTTLVPRKTIRLVREGAAAALHNHARRKAASPHALGHILAAHLQHHIAVLTMR